MAAPAVSGRLGELAVEIEAQKAVARRAQDALDVAPAVLGADGVRSSTPTA
jgi:tellurite resistance protein